MISKAVFYNQFPMEDYGAPVVINESHDEDDDDDDFEHADEAAASSDRPRTARRGIPLAAQRHLAEHDHDVFHLVAYSFIEAKRVMFQPVEFFDNMPTKGGFVEPAIFLGLFALLYSILSAFGKLNGFEFFHSFFSSIIYVVVGAYLASTIIKLGFGGKGNFESTFRVFAFSKATLLFAWISVGTMPVGGYLAIAYTLSLNIIGISKVHEIDRTKAAILVIGMGIVQFAIRLWTKF